MTTSFSRDRWLDKFLNSDKMVKLAKQIEASYIDHVRMIQEGKGLAKWSSVEDALQDFASRHGLTPREVRALRTATKTAQQVPTQETNLQTAEDEGLGSQALEFMSNAKHKHTENTNSPWVLNKKDAPLAKKLRSKETSKHDLHEQNEIDTQGNEFLSSQNTAAYIAGLRKFSGEFGKLLQLPAGVAQESMPKLEEELKGLDWTSDYKILRHAFRFTGLSGKPLRVPGEPVKVTIYEFAVHKRKLAELINEDLRQQLSQELPFEEWIQFLSTLKDPRAQSLQRKLVQMYRDLFHDPAAVKSKSDRTLSEDVRVILQFFPTSYQRKILELLAEGKYRYVTVEKGRGFSNTWRTTYEKGRVVLMESYEPFVRTRPIFENAEQAATLRQALVDKGQKEYTDEEFKALLQSLNISFEELSSFKKQQPLSMGKEDKNPILVHNKPNEKYRPVTNKLSANESHDPDRAESQLVDLNNHFVSTLRRDIEQLRKAQTALQKGKKIEVQLTPLAYEPQPDGSTKELNIFDLEKKDYTAKTIPFGEGEKATLIQNPNAGLHSSFSGSLAQPDMKAGRNKVDLPGTQQTTEWDDVPHKESKKKKTRTPSDEWANYADKSPEELEKELASLKKLKESRVDFIKHQLVKLAEAGTFVDGEGRIFHSEEEVQDTLFGEMLEEARPDILKQVMAELEKWLEQAPKANVPTPQPTNMSIVQTPDEVEDNEESLSEEEQSNELPLAASTTLRLKRLAKLSPKTAARLALLLKRD